MEEDGHRWKRMVREDKELSWAPPISWFKGMLYFLRGVLIFILVILLVILVVGSIYFSWETKIVTKMHQKALDIQNQTIGLQLKDIEELKQRMQSLEILCAPSNH